MKRTISINIASTAFFIDEDAYGRLNDYLRKLESWFSGKDGGQEIINDIENRFRELFLERINPKTGVITLSMVDEVIAIMGQPEDFIPDGDEDAGKQSTYAEAGTSYRGSKRLFRDIDDKVLGGVCSGLAAYFNLDPVLVRILFVLLTFFSFGTGLVVYIVLWIAVPEAITLSQKLEMRGENITISNIERAMKEQYGKAKEQFSQFRKSESFRKGEEYIHRMEKRDQTVLIVIAVVVGLLLLGQITSFFLPFVHFGHSFPFAWFAFPGLIPILVVLLILGLVFRTALKGFLIIIGILVAFFFLLGFLRWFHFIPWFG
ncbi:PspC domain-containing protein [Natronoflexus pectinivorans]|uniref:Phage shock protein C (PspC) family protein n=1 Tax=Natronoflexus pectinivorans TaxID=682526 RepID=A0A4R2GLD6_9BACT|nr:PspC domain-containing protein [Natronoflexus pectinivorans]TCO08301.1 phage shock protein C (PspC) family protein [Natronoflexus pectinivorans]